MSTKSTSCRHVRAALMRAIDERPEGGVDLEVRFAIDLHLESCADCRALHERLALLEEGAAKLAARTETAAERLDLGGAMGRLERALDESPAAEDAAFLAAPFGSLETAETGSVGEFDPKRGTARPLSFFASPWVVAVASIAACTVAFVALQYFWLRSSGPSGEQEAIAVGQPAGGSIGLVFGESERSELETANTAAGSLAEEQAPPVEVRTRESALELLVVALDCAFPTLDATSSNATPPTLPLGIHPSATAELSAAEAVDLQVSDLEASGWPVLRMVEGILRGGENSQAAIRYLGVRGDSTSAAQLTSLLRDKTHARIAVDALGAMAQRGLPSAIAGLTRALEFSEYSLVAVKHLGHAPYAQAAESLADVLRSRRVRARLASQIEGDDSVDDVVLAALQQVGAEAVPSLFQLAQESHAQATVLPAAESVLAALVATPGHGRALAQQLLRDQGSPMAFRTVRMSGDPTLLPWLESRAMATRSSEQAMDVLAEMPGQEVFDVLARLARRDRIAGDRIEGCLRRVLLSNAERAAQWIEERDHSLRRAGKARDLEQRLEFEALTELILAADSPDSGPALVALSCADSLPLDERVWAALALATIGSEADFVELLERIESSSSEDLIAARLFAAQLLGIHRVLGSQATRACLLARGQTHIDAVLVELNRNQERASLAVEVHRVARVLDDRRGLSLAQLQRRNSQ